MSADPKEKELRAQIKSLVTQYFDTYHRPGQQAPFEAGHSRVAYAGRVFDDQEMLNLTDAALDFWLTSGRFCSEFESKFAKYLGLKYSLLVNSGSSANLLAFNALTSPLLKERRLKKGDEVITVAAGFPTTINPALQFGAVPVFVDIRVDDGTYNIDVSQLEAALSDKTKAVMIAHTLGNPFDLKAVTDFCKQHNLWLIEDNCDALGSTYQGQLTGTFGDLATSSFYPPHHMTMGEGGAVSTSNPTLKRAVESLRDWGRDCWCPSGKDNSCRKRFDWQLGELPEGYDHKYIYSHFGYNLKVTEMQAAIGVAQIDKLPIFTAARRKNFAILAKALQPLEEHFVLPKATAHSDPSWFGFLLTLRKTAPFSRNELVRYLEDKKIQTRMLFAGNFLRHPAFDELRNSKQGFRTVGTLEQSNRVTTDTFWLGVYPGLGEPALAYMAEQIRSFVKSR